MSQAKNTDTTTPSGAPAGSAASKSPKKFGRRELLRGTGVAALAVGGAMVPFVAKAGQQHAPEDLRLLDLWRQRTQAWVVANKAQNAYDEADYDAKDAGRTVDVWEFESVYEGFNGNPHHCGETRPMSGADLVSCGARERRIVPYPGAKTTEEARDLSKARQAAEEAERERVVRNANRRLRVAALNRENERLHEIPRSIEDAIIEAPIVGALGIVIKLALEKDYTDHSDAMEQLYRHFARKAGFDPYAEWRATKGV